MRTILACWRILKVRFVHSPMDAAAFYCPYVPLTYSSTKGSIGGNGNKIGGTEDED